MILQRSFIKKTAIAIIALSAFIFQSCNTDGRSETPLNIISYNVLKCTGWPTANVAENIQIPVLMAQELAKYSPDIINFSEAPDEEVVKQIAELLEMNYVFIPTGGNWPGAIITRFEISDFNNAPLVSGERPEDLFTRHWGRATLKITDEFSLIVHSAHLYPHDNEVSAEIRKREITEILKSINRDIENNKSIIVMGDLNHTPDMPEYAQWMDDGFTDSYVAAGIGDGLTVGVEEPYKRIDYILAYGLITEYLIESRALFEGAFRTNPSEPNSFALSDHLPHYAKFILNY